MYDIVGVLMQYVNLQAALMGVIAVQAYKYLVPSPVPGEKSLQTIPGHIWDRILPFVAPITALIVCMILEWNVIHPGDTVPRVTSQDVVRGLLSGLGSDFMLRIYYKTFVGL